MKNTFDLAIRIYIAIIFLIYGIGKIYHIQFGEDNLINISKESSGKEVVWFFFSYSYPYSIIIGIFQCIGACLLLSSKTKFIGYTILIPILFNIILINYFYGVGVIIHSMYYFLLLLISIFLNFDLLLNVLKLLFSKKKNTINFFILLIVFISLLGIGFLINLIA